MGILVCRENRNYVLFKPFSLCTTQYICSTELYGFPLMYASQACPNNTQGCFLCTGVQIKL